MKCACNPDQQYDDCCGRFISGRETPTTPEELMRSRYTAYTQADITYIGNTMKPPALDDFNAEEALRWAKSSKWLKLNVIESSQQKDHGIVEYIAHFLYEDEEHYIHERSEFRRIKGKWYYVDGRNPEKQTPYVANKTAGRNDPCPCGSGKKHKKCCLAG